MRAARAARGGADDAAFRAARNIRPPKRGSRPASPDRRLSRPFPVSRTTTLRAPTAKITRVSKASATKLSRATVRNYGRGPLPHDAASRFPMPYPGMGPGRPARASSPVARTRHQQPANESRERVEAERPGAWKELVGNRLGTASKRRKRPRSANVTRVEIVSHRPMAPPPALSDRAKEYDQSRQSTAKESGKWPGAPTAADGRRVDGRKKLKARCVVNASVRFVCRLLLMHVNLHYLFLSGARTRRLRRPQPTTALAWYHSSTYSQLVSFYLM